MLLTLLRPKRGAAGVSGRHERKQTFAWYYTRAPVWGKREKRKSIPYALHGV